MANWDDLLNPFTQTNTTGTKAKPKTPAVIRRGDVFKNAFANVPSMQKPPEPTGWKGVVSDVLGSPIGKALTEVGNIVSIPGRAVVGAVEEFRDAVDGNPNTRASWDDFTKNVSDESYGFGTFAGDVFGDSGFGKWANRALGLAGDILLDPTTWLTLGTSKALTVLDDAGNLVQGAKALRVAGAEGRITLAKRVLEKTGDTGLASRVARYGRSAIKDADVFEKIGLDRAGLYFMGKRLPGTGRIGEAFEKGFTTMRTWSGDHMFKRANELFNPLDAKAARKALLRGTTSDETVGEYLYMVLSRNKQLESAGAAGRAAAGEVKQVLDKYGVSTLRDASQKVRNILERGTVVEAAADDSIEMQIARDVQGWLQGKWQSVRDELDKFDTEAPLGQVDKYFPHMLTDKANRMMGDVADARLSGIREQVWNPLDPAGSFNHRMVEGSDFFGYKLTAEDLDGGVDRLNEIARQYGDIDFNFFETDLTTVLSRYVDQYADQMGIVARKKYLVDKGVFKRMNERLYIDEDIWKASRKKVTETTKARSAASKKASELVNDVVSRVEKLLKKAEESPASRLEQVNAGARSVLRESREAREAVYSAKKALSEAYDNLAVQRGVLNALYDENPPAIVTALEEQLDAVVSQVESLTSEIDNLDWGSAYTTGRLRNLQKELDALNAREQLLYEYGDVIERNLDNIIAGKDVPGYEKLGSAVRGGLSPETRVEGGRELLIAGGAIPAAEDKELFNLIRDTLKRGNRGGDAGEWTPKKQEMLLQDFKARGGRIRIEREGAANSTWWKNANITGDITEREVMNMNPQMVADVVMKASKGEATLHEMRVAALSIASSDTQHSREIWVKLFGDGSQEGAGIMADAARSELFFNTVNKLGRKKNRFLRLQSWTSNSAKVQDDIVAELSRYAAATKMLKMVFEKDVDAATPFTGEMLDAIIQQDDSFAPLRKAFEGILNDGEDDIVTRAWSQADNYSPQLGGYVIGRETSRQPINFTFGEFISSLQKIVDDVEDGAARHTFNFEVSEATKNLKQGANIPTERTFEVVLADYIGELGPMVDNDQPWEDVIKYIEDIVYGDPETRRLARQSQMGRLPVTGQGPSARRVQRVTTGPDMAVWTGGAPETRDVLDTIWGQIDEYKRELNSEEFSIFLDAKPAFNDGSSSISSVLVDVNGQKKNLTSLAADEAERKLANNLIEFWFRSEVTSRFDKTVELLQPFGLVPTQDYYRRIVNEVAKTHGENIGRQMDEISAVWNKLSSLSDNLNRSAGEYATDPRRLEKEIRAIADGHGEIIARFGGRVDASDLRDRWIRVGGARPANTGESGKIAKANRVLASSTATAEEKLQAREIINSSRSADVLELERNKIYESEIVPWFRSLYGRKPSNRIEASEALREMATVHKGYGKLSSDASFGEMKKWVNTVTRGLGDSLRNMRRNGGWLYEAANPFVDVRKLRIGSGGAPQDLPSLYSTALRVNSEKYQRLAAELAGEYKSADKASQAFAASIAPAAQAQTLTDALVSGKQADLFEVARSGNIPGQLAGIDVEEIERARVAYQKYVKMLQTPEYASATERLDLHELLNDLAGYDFVEDVKFPVRKPKLKVLRERMSAGEKVYELTSGGGQWKYKLASNPKEMFASGEKLYVRTSPYNKPAEYALVSSIDEAKKYGGKVFVGEFVGKPDTYKLVKNPSDLVQGRIYVVHTPTDFAPSAASVERMQKQIADMKSRAASLRKQADDIDNNAKGWYKSSIEGADVRDLDARRKAKAQFDADKERAFAMRSEADSLQRTASGYESNLRDSFEEVRPTAKNAALPDSYEYTPFTPEDVPGQQRFVRESGVGNDARYRQVSDAEVRMGVQDKYGGVLYKRRIKENPIIMTRAEYASLFVDPQDIAKQYDNMQWLIAQRQKRLAELKNRMWTLTGRGRDATKMAADVAKQPKLQKAIQDLSYEIDVINRELPELNKRLESLAPGVQESALQKAHSLQQLIKRGDIQKDELLEGLRGATAAQKIADTRRTTLQRLWSESEDSKVINEVNRYANSFQVGLANRVTSTSEELVRHSNNLRMKAQESWGVFSDANAPYGITESGVIRQEPVVGVAGARRRLSEVDEEIRGRLENLTKATQNQLDALERFDTLTNGGLSPTQAIERIVEEVSALNPSDVAYVRASELASIAARRAELRAEVDFFWSQRFAIAKELWTGKNAAAGLDLKRTRQMLVDNAEKLRAELDKYRPDWDKSQAELIDWAQYKATDAERRLLKAELEYTRASVRFDQARTQRMRLESWHKSVAAPLRQERDSIVGALDTITKRLEGKEGGDFRVAEVLNWLEEYDDTLYSALSPDDFSAIMRLKTDLLASQKTLLDADIAKDWSKIMFDAIENTQWGAIIEREASKGWENLAKHGGLPSYQARAEIAQMVQNFSRMREPEFVRSLNRFLGGYTGFFKAYATASPGFVVRNSISNTFALVAAGASPRRMSEGLGIFREWREALKTNSVEKWLAGMSEAKRVKVQTAISVMDASGYGKAGEAFALFKPNRRWLVENKYIKTFRNANEVAENSARFMLAWDSVVKGGDFDMSVARVRRHLFDYQNVSSADMVLRTIIPFWFWMSRNLPLQLTNQWLNPRAYNIYNNVMKNIGGNEEEDPTLPIWMREGGAVRLGGDFFFNPDVGVSRVSSDLQALADPMRLMSDVNPAIRLPFELVGGRKLYNDTPFSSRAREAVGGPLSPAVQMLANLLGQSKMTPDGQQGVTDKFNFAARSLIPVLGQAERLLPESDYGKEQALSSRLAWLGIPIREVTQAQRDAELRRQQREAM